MCSVVVRTCRAPVVCALSRANLENERDARAASRPYTSERRDRRHCDFATSMRIAALGGYGPAAYASQIAYAQQSYALQQHSYALMRQQQSYAQQQRSYAPQIQRESEPPRVPAHQSFSPSSPATPWREADHEAPTPLNANILHYLGKRKAAALAKIGICTARSRVWNALRPSRKTQQAFFSFFFFCFGERDRERERERERPRAFVRSMVGGGVNFVLSDHSAIIRTRGELARSYIETTLFPRRFERKRSRNSE